MLRRINRALPGMIMGILLYGIVVELAGVWFVADKLRYTTGLWIGIAAAVGMSVHMAVILFDSMDLSENGAKSKVTMQYMLRYLVLVIIFFVTAYFELGNVVMLFFGVMGLKAGAYLQPFTDKIISKITGRGDESSTDEEYSN